MSEPRSEMTTTEVAKYLGISTATVVKYEKRGLLVPTRRLPTGKRFYSSNVVEDFYNSMCVKKEG